MTLASAVSRLPPGLCHLFPRLLQLIWIEGKACLLRGDIGGILRQSTSIESITLRFDHGEHPFLDDITVEHLSFCRDSVIHLCATVSHAKPALERLVLDIPLTRLKCVELQACISDDSSLGGPVFLNRPQLTGIERLEVLWTPACDLRSLPRDVSLDSVHYLAVRSMEQEPQSRFPADVARLTTFTTAHLTSVEIYFLNLSGTSLYCGSFRDFIAPLTARGCISHVSLVLTGYCFDFSAHDLHTMTRAWPALETLNLSFDVAQSGVLPDLQNTIPHMPRQCPHLRYLHLPAITTLVERQTTFTIPYTPDNQLRHLSSDVLMVQHGILDIAFGLRWAFPHLVHFGPPGDATCGPLRPEGYS
ncbi:hypothetical protein C2E23DRAFT_883098 [Lenzites betulinus]|nr:hypothetical protein C2E23DRAFT_883098 [Lenzites betulinus]